MKEAPIPPGFRSPFFLDMRDCLPPVDIPRGDKTATKDWLEGRGGERERERERENRLQ